MNLIYEGGSNRMIKAGGVTFAYDTLGNSNVANGISRWQFDPFNRMTTAFGNTYYIDPQGQRLMKTVGSATTYFAPDESNHLLAEYNGGMWVDYLWLNGRLIGRIHGGQVQDIHVDHLGRPEAMTDVSQTLVWRAMNLPFTRSVATNNVVPLNIGFPGQYFDAEISLWNNGYRDYFDWVGRYLESDPVGLAGGINTYAYVGGNPVALIDILGLCWHFSQSTGQLTHVDGSGNTDINISGGYAGHDDGVNNSAMQGVPNTGPLPQGRYTIGPMRENRIHSGTVLHQSMRLTPDPGNQMFGRGGFLIHRDNGRNNKTGSNGCIVESDANRRQISDSQDDCLQVAP